MDIKRFLVDKSSIKNDRVIIDGKEHNHLKNVLRMTAGATIIVTCNDEYDYYCKVEEIQKNFTICKIESREINNANPNANLTVFQALIKGDNMPLVVQKLSELGVAKIVPFESRYVTSKDSSNKVLKLQETANQSCKQCDRSLSLEVEKVLKFKEVVEKLKNYDLVVFANETQKSFDLKKYFTENKIENLKIAVVVGSEGGFSEEEIIQLKNLSNVESVSLGRRILKAETASIAIATIVLYEMGELNNL